MKVHLLVHTAGTVGGTERVAWGWSGWLARRGWEVHLWASRGAAAPPGVRLRRYPGPSPRGRPWRILHTHGLVSQIDEDGLKVAFVRAAGADLWRAGGGCHADWLEAAGRSSWADRLERETDHLAARSARRVVANSALGADGLRRHCGVPSERLVVVRNGVDLQRFQPGPCAAPPFAHPWAVFLGSGYERKNLETALRALALVSGLGLLVLGRESRPRRWQALARSLGVSDRVCFRGAVRAPEHHLPGARAFLLPTRYDPSANATLEAMACGVPPVFSGRDGASELAPEPWMVVEDPHDHEAVAMTLQRVLERPELAGRVRAVAEEWPASRCFSALEEELRALAGGGPGEGA